jgi:hypothetical protein
MPQLLYQTIGGSYDTLVINILVIFQEHLSLSYFRKKGQNLVLPSLIILVSGGCGIMFMFHSATLNFLELLNVYYQLQFEQLL